MLRNRSIRVLVLVLLIALLNTPWISAQGRPNSSVEVRAAVGLWEWLVRTLQKEGCCTLDPDGRTCARNSDHLHDNGCTLDPDGCSSFGPKPDAGCTLDPNGRCVK
jgi:hypothetical protein